MKTKNLKIKHLTELCEIWIKIQHTYIKWWDDKSTENELIVWCYGTTTLNKANKDLFKIELIQKDMLKFMFLKNKTN